MGKASSNKKVARAAKAAGRPGAKKNYAWPLAIGAVVVLGVVLIVASFGGGSSNAAPRIGDHWHAAYGVYDCDGYMSPARDVAGDQTGIHTHEDGLMHMHPFASRVTGDGSNLEAFGEDVGMEIGDTSIEGVGIDRENGDECADGEPGTVRLLTWDNPGDEEPTVITEDIAKYAPPNNSVWALVFAPEDAEIPPPPSIINLQDPTAAEEGRETPSATTVPEGSEGDTDDTTSTTVAGSDDTTTTTAAGSEDTTTTSSSTP
jgi:hypothetical protein